MPNLVLGQEEPASFLVRGIVRLPEDAGIAFLFATDGQRRLTAVYAPYDGTPLFLSDGQRTIALDLAAERVVVAEHSYVNVNIKANPGEEYPLRFELGLRFGSHDDPEQKHSSLLLEQYIHRSRDEFKLENSFGDLQLFRAPRPTGQEGDAELLQVKKGDSSWFRYSYVEASMSPPQAEIDASYIGRELPPGTLAFPDEKQFPKELRVSEVSGANLQTLLTLVQTRLLSPAVMLANLVEGPGPATDVAREPDFAARYRAALKSQGIEMKVYERPQP